MDELDRYLEELKVVLGPLGESQADEICAEIRAHIQDTVDRGDKSLGEVLQALGSPEELGRNYLGELGAGAAGGNPGPGDARARSSASKVQDAEGGPTDGKSAVDQAGEDFFGGFREKLDARVFSAMAREAAKAAEEAMKALGDINFDSFGKTDFDDPEQRWKLGAFGHLGDLGKQDFGDRMDEFGEHMDRFGEQMGRWGEEFGRRMEKVGEALGKHMGSLGEKIGNSMAGAARQEGDGTGFADCSLSLDFDSRQSTKILVPGATVFVKPGAEGDERLRLDLVIRGLALGEVCIEPVEHEGAWVLDLAALARPGIWLRRVVIQVPAGVADLVLESRGGDVLASGLDLEKLGIRTWGGNISSEANGGIQELESCGGNISCIKPADSLTMKTDAGNLEIRECGGMRNGYLETLAGNIHLEGVEALSAGIEFDLETQAGRVEVQGRNSGNSWKGVLGPAGSGNEVERIEARTLAGNIRVE